MSFFSRGVRFRVRLLAPWLVFWVLCRPPGGHAQEKASPVISLGEHNAYGAVAVSPAPGEGKSLVITAEGDETPWGTAIRWPVMEPVAGDEVLWLRVVGRAPDVPGEETGEMAVPVMVERQQPPYTRHLHGRMRFGPQSGEQILVGVAAGDLPADSVHVNFHLGGLRGTLVLEEVELVRHPPGTDPDDLPRSPVTWEGMAPDAAWRARAGADIRAHRAGTLRVRVLDAAGDPVEGLAVTATQQNHAFAFGTAVNNQPMLDPNFADGETYRRKLVKYFEWATVENSLKWQALDWGTWGGAGNMAAHGGATVNKIRELGLVPRGHVLLWPSYNNSPAFLRDADDAELAVEIEKRVRGMAAKHAGDIPEWDALNEIWSNHDFQNRLGNPLLKDVFTWAREEAPDTRLFINDYNILSNGNLNSPQKDFYFKSIQKLLEAGAPLGGIGMQGHFGAIMPGVTEMRDTLDRFASFGLPIRITEYDHDIPDENVQADFFRDVLTLAFSHPAVDGFFVWGFWDGRHWKNNAPFFRQDWSEKPALAVWRELVFGAWWTGEQRGTTDAGGRVAFPNAFHGDYRIEAPGYGARILKHRNSETECILTPPDS